MTTWESGALPELFALPNDETKRNYISDKEIDFVAKKGDRIIYLQSTYLLVYEQTIQCEYAPLQAIPDNYEKAVVSLDDVSFPSNKGIRHIYHQYFIQYEV